MTLTLLGFCRSVMYFVQLMPAVGPFVNNIQRMFGVMISFIIVFILMIFPFPHVFMVLLRGEADRCNPVEGFETIFDGFYSSFLIMLNINDFSDYNLSGN